MFRIKEQTACFTGHRRLSASETERIGKTIEKVLIHYINCGYRYFGAGGALGFDTIAAATVLRLKEKYSYIKLILVLPCKYQTLGWKEKDILEYERIKEKADKVVYISEEYTNECMLKRNRHLVNYSSLCICYLRENEKSGTSYTVNYAKLNGLIISNIADMIEKATD